jgi:hypothetical protein
VQLGFAVFVALFLLVRFERTIKALTTAIYRSSDMQLQAIQQLGAIIREEKGIPQPPVHVHKRHTDSEVREPHDA